ncbi:hypothetical protein [Nonomuraea sp. SBT364]|uniref:hypothetical protein n=1 Tax=Nonomuraea sp. SBT364 TaxID=1580530 RepID=UPI00066B408F|nr:hypothetical protein [Nonomuraea sp. SBT364]
MLTSKARRRLALKVSASGIVGTLVVFAGAALTLSSPASAAADKTLSIVYTCSGGPFTNTSLTVPVTVPDTASGTFEAKWAIPALTLKTSPNAADQVKVGGKLTVEGGTHADLAKNGGTVTSGSTAVPTFQVTSSVTVTATTGGKVTLKPTLGAGSLTLALASSTNTADVTTCQTTSTTSVDVTVGTDGGGTGTDIIEYDCTLSTTGGTDAAYPATVDIKVTPTMPTGAKANQDASITWTGTVQTTGDPLKVPAAGFPANSKIFASLKASGAGTPTTPVIGEAALTATAGQSLTTLPTVTVKVKPTTTGTVTITPGDIVFGTSATAPTVKCTAPTTGLKTYTFTVAAATSTPTSTPTTTSTPTPTKTTTVYQTVTPTSSPSKTTSSPRSSETPKEGADTGAGGTMGPDGRMFLAVGSVLIVAAGAGGLLIRRRGVTKG